MALTRVAPAGIGSTPGTGYVIGDSFLHATGLNATNGYYTGIVTAQTFRVLGNFQVDGTTTTLDTEITSVDKLEVAANNNTVGVAITQSGTGDILRLYDGSSQVVTVDDEGQIGIGANAPSANLDIAETGFVNVKIRTSGTNSATLNLQNSQRNYSVNTIPGGAFSIHDSTANLSRLRIESGGNVGINTNAPSAPLTVYSRSDGASVNTNPGSDTNTFQINRATSTLLFNGTGTSKISKGGHSPGNLQIESQNSNIEFLAGGSERLRIKSNGNIGIGTNNPEQNLHIQDASEPTVSFWTGSTKRSAFQGQSTGTYIYSYQGQPLLFSVGSGNSFSEKVRITSTGLLGIGTTDPVSKLHLADNVNTTNNILTIQGTSWGDGEKVFTTYKRGSVHLGRFGVEADGAGQAGQLIFECGNGGSPVERLRITSDGELNLTNGTINLGTADSSSGHINAYELMTFNIDSDNDDSNRHFTWYKNAVSGTGTGMMRLDESGRLVIGGDLASSGNNLTLKHATDVEIDMHATSGSGNNFRIKSDSAGAFTIRDHSAGGNRLIITDSGDVLIGDFTPVDTRNTGGIHIRHSKGISFKSNTSQSVSRNWRIRNDDYGWGNLDFSVGNAVNEWGDSAGDVVMSLTSNRNVGIGDLAPSEKLNVAGNIMLEGGDQFMYLTNVGTGNAGIYVRGNSSSSFLRSHSTGMFTWEVTGSEKMRLDATGNLGLGCVPGSSTGYRTLQIGDGTNTGGQIWLKNGANANYYNWHDGTGVHFYGQSAGNLRFYTTSIERFRIDSVGRALLGRQRTIGGGTYYDDLTINNSNTASGADGGAGIDLISGNNSWGGYIFSDSDAHARGYLKYDHGDDEMVFGTSSANRIILDSDGRLLIGGSATVNPGNANNTFALQVVGSYTHTGQKHGALFRYGEASSNSSIIRFEKNRSNTGGSNSVQNGDNLGELQFYGTDNAGAYKLGAQIEAEVDGQNPANGTVPTRLVFKTTPAGTNQTPIERFRITRDGGLRVEDSDYNDLIGCTGEHSGPSNSQYKTNTKTNLTTGTWYTIAIAPTGRNFASFMIQDTASSRHTCYYFNAGHQYGGLNYQNCINVIGASGTHNTQVFGAVRIKAYGTYDGAMLQVYIQNSVNQVTAYMVGENLAPQRWRMRDWIADGTDPTGLSNWASIQASGNGLSAYADLAAISAGGASFSGPVIPGLDNTYNFGTGNRRWTTLYATNSTINTSDITLKRDVTVLNDAEMRAAANISKQFKQYRWNDSYAEKGDDARYHSGIMAQTVRDAMLAEGLDPTRYGFYCVDTWYEDSEGTRISKFYPAGSLVDEDDPAFNTPDEGEPEIPANMSLVTRYSLRYEELLCFIAAYNEQRFASLESRLSALES